MRKLSKKILFILLILALAATVFGLAACSNKEATEDPGDDIVRPADPNNRTKDLEPSEYFARINTGLVNGQTELGGLKDYHVSSKMELYTSVENLTVRFEGVYKENRRNGKYYISVFDNNEHLDRLLMYYDGSTLYVTVRDLHYKIEEFGALMIFDGFSAFVDLLDIGEIVYGDFMQDTFGGSRSNLLLAGLGKKDFMYTLVGETGESITITYDLWMALGVINDNLAGLTENIGSTFDAVSDHYLGFEFSKLIKMSLGSFILDEIRFNMTSDVLKQTTVKINGLMQDSSPYFMNADYSYDVEKPDIAAAKGLATAYVYDDVTPDKASFEGKTVLPQMRDTDFDFALDYEVKPEDNTQNNVTLRIYDQLATQDELSAATKYDHIRELFGAYYRDERAYLNFEGLYDYIGEVIALETLRLPKIYFSEVNLSGLMNITFNYAYRSFRVLTDPAYRESSQGNSRLFSRLINAIESDVPNKEIRITVTEELIKELRGDNTPLAVVLGKKLKLDERTLQKLGANDFLENMRVIVRYNFGTGVLGIDVYNGTELIMTNDMKKAEHLDVRFPYDLNDLNYAEFLEPDVVTLSLEMTFNPYGTRYVDTSGFFGCLVGDYTGKNTPQSMGVGEDITARGRVSEYYVTDYTGERVVVTTMNLNLYLRNAGKGQETLLATLITNPSNTDELLVTYYGQMGVSSQGKKQYKIDRHVVTEHLDLLAGGESIFGEASAVSAFMDIYNKADKNARAYTQDGYFSVDLMVTEENDPVYELVGIKDVNARVRARISFDPLDLSAVKADDYFVPYIHSEEAVSASSIYSSGSKWKERMTVSVGSATFEMYTTYDEESITIETGKMNYHPVAQMFGKTFEYTLHIVNLTGTYKIKQINLDYSIGGTPVPDGVMIIDPAFYAATPTTVEVTFDGGEKGILNCEIENFPDSRITADGYNLALFAGVLSDVEKNKLVIGKDSIASVEQDIYVAVKNRRVIALTDENGKDRVYVVNGEQVPLVAEFTADPYTFAMRKRLNESAGLGYDYLEEEIRNERITINFDNLYAVETVYDEATGQDVEVERRFEGEGYNWNYLSDLELEWEFSQAPFSWRGETRYAVAYYGNKEYERNVVKVAIKVEISAKTVEAIVIDDYADGTYLIDYLVESSYSIPMSTTADHTVKAVFSDKTERIISLTRSALITDDEYCTKYIYGQLMWDGAAAVPSKLELDGSYGLFGSGTTASNTTTALFGGDLQGDTQKVSINVIAPTRAISGKDYYAMSLVTRIDVNDEGEAVMNNPEQTNVVGTARYTKPAVAGLTEVESYGINPYNKNAVLPETIWLYVNMTMAEGANARKEWREYPVYWTTKDRNGEELNIIRMNDDGRYVLAHPVTEETYLKVYGQVGAPGRRIWVEMSIVNLASDIRSYMLFLPSGESFDTAKSVDIDPHLSYAKDLPSSFVAVLGSGQEVQGETDWYYGDFPIVCTADRIADKDRKLYRQDGDDGLYYYVFPISGGNFELSMVVSAGEVSNDIYLNASAQARTLNVENGSNFVDVYALKEDGTPASPNTTYNGTAPNGYTDVNYYTKASSTLLARIDELIANDGVGTAGFTYVLVDENKLYAKSVVWDLVTLERIRNTLLKKSSVREYVLEGTIDTGTINETRVRMRVSLNTTYATLSDVGLVRSANMVDKKVYSIKNDTDRDKRINLINESSSGIMTLTEYYRTEEYKLYFDTEEGYTDKEFSGFIFFEIDYTFLLSKNQDGTYTSPYAYFQYLVENMELKFTSEQRVIANASAGLSLGGVTESYFNSSVLGFVNKNIRRDNVAGTAKSYSFLILEKLSEGSAVDRLLLVISAEVSEVYNLQRNDEIDAFGDDLNELYPEGVDFTLPKTVEVEFRRVDGSGSYKAKYAVPGWTPNSATYFGDLALRKTIEANKIDVLKGTTYGFKYLLPDMDRVTNNESKTFNYTVKFRKKDIARVNYNGSARSALYDIHNGKIVVSNTYNFLEEDTSATDASKKYVFNKDAIPTILQMNPTATYERGENDSYEVKWTFTENAAFGEDIFRLGTSEEGVLIATYTFASYYGYDENGALEHKEQTIELYLVLAPMEFMGIESMPDAAIPLTVVMGESIQGENEKRNTIVIDPYEDMGNNGRFQFPTALRITFNDGETYDFTNIIYYLADKDGNPSLPRTSVQYGENGHNQTEYSPDSHLLRLVMYVRGYNVAAGRAAGIRINVAFLQRSIDTVRIPNNAYTQEEAGDAAQYVYNRDESENVVYNEDGEPSVKTYYAFARYDLTYDGVTEVAESGRLPVYYVDPYNTATFRLPQKAAFEFLEEAGVYTEYTVSGWQYYNEDKRAYESFPTTRVDNARFYSDGEKKQSYFNPSATSYEGGAYSLRGFITVGNDYQYFDMVVIVLNRTLRATAVMQSEYYVSYDFDDPIAAMLSDIPAMLGENAFVDFDRYNETFSVKTVRTVNGTTSVSTMAFTLEEGSHFSQKDGSGKAGNVAVVPKLLWNSAYDTDGDGAVDYTFEDLTTTGFDGEIKGNLYNGDGDLAALIDFFDKKENAAFDQLVRALMWDYLFDEYGNISSSFSQSAKTKIREEEAAYRIEVIYAAYRSMTSITGTDEDLAKEIKDGQALSSENKGTLTSTIFNSILQTINMARQNNGLTRYDRDDENDRPYIVYEIYRSIETAYEAWRSVGGTKTSEAEIYIVWKYFIETYQSRDVKKVADLATYGGMSANQVLKAKHYYNFITAEGGVVGAEEKNKLNAQFAVYKNDWYVETNAATWKAIYAVTDDREKEVMDEYLRLWGGLLTSSGYSLAMDFLREEQSGITTLGAKGEPATADVSIPVISFRDLTVNDSETPKTIRFNKFNFRSIDVSFTVEFEVDYEAIYERMLEDAKEQAIASFRDDKKEQSMEEYASSSVTEAVDNVNPKDSEGNAILQYGGEAFGYDMWARGNRANNYASFYETLYAYRQNDAVRVVTENIGQLYRDYPERERYAAMSGSFSISIEEWQRVVDNFYFIRVPEMALDRIDAYEKAYGIDNAEQRGQVLDALVTYVLRELALSDKGDAFEAVGIDRNAAIYGIEVTDNILLTAETTFRTETMKRIADKRLAKIAVDCDLAEGLNIESNRRSAARMLANFILEEDIEVCLLNDLYAEQETESRITLSKSLMSKTYGNTNAQSVANGLAREQQNTPVTTATGYGVMFAYSYSNIVNVLYELLSADGNVSQAKALFNSILADYESSESSYRKGIIDFLAINGDSPLNTYANLYFEMLTVYAKGAVSPYDQMIQSGKAFALTGFTEEQINGMLPYTVINEVAFDVLAGFTEELGATVGEIRTALQKRAMFTALGTSVSSGDRPQWTAFEEDAYRPIRIAAMDRLFRNLNDTYADTLKTAYDTSSATANLRYYTFNALVEKAIAEGEAKNTRYEEYKQAYVSENAYRYSKALLDALFAEYEAAKAEGSTGANLSDAGDIAHNVYEMYFEGERYRTIDDYSDDYYDPAYMGITLQDVLARNGLSSLVGEGRNRVLTGYVQDFILRALVLFCDTVASNDEKAIVEEVSLLYTKVTDDMSLEGKYVKAAENGTIGGTVGVAIYGDLKDRYDFSESAKEALDACYYTVWYENMKGATDKMMSEYPEADINAATDPREAQTIFARRFIARIAGKTESTLSAEEEQAAVRYGVELARLVIYNRAQQKMRFETNYQNVVTNALSTEATLYAYDRMYDEQTERGTYVYRNTLDEILERIVLTEAEDLNERIFDEAQSKELNEKIFVLEDAVLAAAKTVLRAELYDDIKLFTLDPTTFASAMYTFLTGMESDDPVTALLGTNIGGGGIVGTIVEAFRRAEGEEDLGETINERLNRLDQWWVMEKTVGDSTEQKEENETVYGILSAAEQEFLGQIYNQAKYQTISLLGTRTNINAAQRKRLALATMIASVYLFLRDLEDAQKSVPADYYSVGNEDERKAYLIGLMLDGDLLNDEGHNLSLAKARLLTLALEKAQQRAKLICDAVGKSSYYAGAATTEEFLQAIEKALIFATTPYGLEDADLAVYAHYMRKAVGYVEYTSVLGAKEYEHYDDPVTGYPLSRYANAVYVAVTGKDMENHSVASEDPGMFGMLSFSYFYDAVKNTGVADAYAAAMEKMKESRVILAGDFRSEDYYMIPYEDAMKEIKGKIDAGLPVTKAEYEAAERIRRHVLYFDRKEWDDYLLSEKTATVTAHYSDRNVYVANSEKTSRYVDADGGYAYKNALRAQGMEFMLSDFTTIDLFFETTADDPYREEYANVMTIDALSPELPRKAYARGHINVGGVEKPPLELGEVTITEYSEEFYKLVYHKTEPTADDAYQIRIEADSGFVFTKQSGIKVGYKDRNVSNIYLETPEYINGAANRVTDGEFEGYYSIFDTTEGSETRGKNVIYIEPTNESLLLPAQKSYILPTTLHIKCPEGASVHFTDVEWDLTDVPYGLAGTGDAGIPIRVKKYRYTDETGDIREIRYDYSASTVRMDVYSAKTGEKTSSRSYTLSREDMIEWNTVLVVSDQSLESITDLTTSKVLGSAANGIVDTTGSIEINPYYPEFPTELMLRLKAGDMPTVTLQQSDWQPSRSKLRAIQRGDANDLYFTATFPYLGYELTVRFAAMDISVPRVDENGQLFNGGRIYLVRGEGDVKTQFERNYSEMYFNFNEEGEPNWQKVPVALERYSDVRIGEEEVQEVRGIIGDNTIGNIDANAIFYVQVVSPKTYAMLNGTYNPFVSFDYYVAPADKGSKASGMSDPPETYSGVYLYTYEGETETFRTQQTTEDMINNRITVLVEYDYDESTSKRLAFDENGTRVRQFSFTEELRQYERSEVTVPTFDKDATDKKWTWSPIPETNVAYKDAIYWPIGTAMKASDLPRVYDKGMDASFSLIWDLNGLNVNRANVEIPGEIGDADGTVVYGYYMQKNGTWVEMALTVYIEKINITDAVIGFRIEDDNDPDARNESRNINKTYDGQYYILPFDPNVEELKLLRENGEKENLGEDAFIVRYAAAEYDEHGVEVTDFNNLVWSEGEYPLNAGKYYVDDEGNVFHGGGKYYIRVDFKEADYNAYIDLVDGHWLFSLTIAPQIIDLSKLHFDGEDDRGIITRVYGVSVGEMIVTEGLPKVIPAGWFSAAERENMYSAFVADGKSEKEAKALVYARQIAVVTDVMREKFAEWYAEGRAMEGTSDETTIQAWVYDNKMTVADPSVVEAKVVVKFYQNGEEVKRPSNVGSYVADVSYDVSDGNYAQRADRTKSLILTINKDQTLVYAVANTTLTYNGNAQNPQITGLHNNGTLPYGVTVTYSYSGANGTLVVRTEGKTDSNGNARNEVTIESVSDDWGSSLPGIKDFGTYECNITISGGENFIDGQLNDVRISIAAANLYIMIDDIVTKYLDDVANLNDYVRIYDGNGNLQGSGRLLGTDKISDLGIVSTDTEVASHFKVGSYVSRILGMRVSASATTEYTNVSTSQYPFMGSNYNRLTLRTFTQEGSLYKDAEGNARLIKLFQNYNIFIREENSYRIEQESGSDGVRTNEEWKAYIDALQDNETAIVYLQPLVDGSGNIMPYDAVTINKTVNLTIVGYRSNGEIAEESEIETLIAGITVLKGIVTLRIVNVVGSVSGEAAIRLDGKAGRMYIYDSLVTAKEDVDNVIGLKTEINYTEGLYIDKTTFKGLSVGLQLNGGELEIEESRFTWNYNGLEVRWNEGNVIEQQRNKVTVKTTTFDNQQGIALLSVLYDVTARENVFEYNYIALDLPEDSTVRTNVNNNNVFDGNGDDANEND